MRPPNHSKSIIAPLAMTRIWARGGFGGGFGDGFVRRQSPCELLLLLFRILCVCAYGCVFYVSLKQIEWHFSRGSRITRDILAPNTMHLVKYMRNTNFERRVDVSFATAPKSRPHATCLDCSMDMSGHRAAQSIEPSYDEVSGEPIGTAQCTSIKEECLSIESLETTL